MTISRYAVVENGTVSNVVLWDGETDWAPPIGAASVALADTDAISIGWTYDGKQFAAPPESEQSSA